MPFFSDEHFFFSFSNTENINNIEGAAQGFSRCFGKFHNKKGVQDKKKGQVWAIWSKTSLKGACLFKKGHSGSYAFQRKIGGLTGDLPLQGTLTCRGLAMSPSMGTGDRGLAGDIAGVRRCRQI